MTTTVNISLPKEMYKDIKRIVKERRYTSVSELIRDSVRQNILEGEITENGFPRWFEDKVLEAEKSPIENDTVLETDKDVDRFFDKLHSEIEKVRNGKNS